jgi:hypothetical protein
MSRLTVGVAGSGRWRYVVVAISLERALHDGRRCLGRAPHGGSGLATARPVRTPVAAFGDHGTGPAERLGGAQVLHVALLERVGAGLAGARPAARLSRGSGRAGGAATSQCAWALLID